MLLTLTYKANALLLFHILFVRRSYPLVTGFANGSYVYHLLAVYAEYFVKRYPETIVHSANFIWFFTLSKNIKLLNLLYVRYLKIQSH